MNCSKQFWSGTECLEWDKWIGRDNCTDHAWAKLYRMIGSCGRIVRTIACGQSKDHVWTYATEHKGHATKFKGHMWTHATKGGMQTGCSFMQVREEKKKTLSIIPRT